MIARVICRYSFRRFATLSMSSNENISKFYVKTLDERLFAATFQCTIDDLNIKRQFNFQRNIHEPLEDFIGRIKVNVEKIVKRKKERKKKKSPVSKVVDSVKVDSYPVDIVALVDGEEVSNEKSCREIFFENTNSSKKMRILGHEYDVIVNCPWVDSISLPASFMIGFAVFPNKVEVSHGDLWKSKFEWFVEDREDHWAKVCEGLCYTPTLNNLGKKLKLICYPSDGNSMGPEKEVVSTEKVKSGPGPCPFEERQLYTPSYLDSNSVRVVSYNILADAYANTKEAKTELFPYCPSYAMALDYRKQLYIKEILGYKADIICLQEVDEKVFFNEFTLMFKDSYEGKYVRKSGNVREGVATFYSTDKFRLVESHRHIVSEAGKSLEEFWLKLSINSDICQRLSELHTSLQIVLLERICEPSHKLVVANTHLYFHPEADHLRLAQGAICMQLLENYISDLEKSNPDNRYTLLFCGDFNSTPDCGFYTLMTKNNVPKTAKDWSSNGRHHVSNIELNQRFPMASAYGTPRFTNYTHAFADCLDYIYYQNSHLDVLQAVPLPDESVLKRHTAIPSVVFPSDHLALVADFQILPS